MYYRSFVSRATPWHAFLLVFALLLSPFSVAHAAATDSNGGLTQVTTVGGGVGQVVFQGTHAFVSEGSGLTMFDASSPASFVQQARSILEGTVSGMVPVGNLLVLTLNRPSPVFNQVLSQLVLLDVSNIQTPVVRSKRDISARLRVVAATSSTAYLASDTQLALISIQDVANPTLLSNYIRLMAISARRRWLRTTLILG